MSEPVSSDRCSCGRYGTDTDDYFIIFLINNQLFIILLITAYLKLSSHLMFDLFMLSNTVWLFCF